MSKVKISVNFMIIAICALGMFYCGSIRMVSDGSGEANIVVSDLDELIDIAFIFGALFIAQGVVISERVIVLVDHFFPEKKPS